MGTGGSPDYGHLCGLWWQYRPWMFTQTLAVVGPLTQPDLDVTATPGSKQAFNTSLPLPPSFLPFCLFLQHMNRSATLSLLYFPIYLLIILRPTCPVPKGPLASLIGLCLSSIHLSRIESPGHGFQFLWIVFLCVHNRVILHLLLIKINNN